MYSLWVLLNRNYIDIERYCEILNNSGGLIFLDLVGIFYEFIFLTNLIVKYSIKLII